MNCKPGDLAVVIRSHAGHEGKIVRCIRFLGKVHLWNGSDRWETDIELPNRFGNVTCTMRDAYLRPIRNPGDDAVDETLQRLPAPITQPKIKEDKSEVAA